MVNVRERCLAIMAVTVAVLLAVVIACFVLTLCQSLTKPVGFMHKGVGRQRLVDGGLVGSEKSSVGRYFPVLGFTGSCQQ